MWHRFVILFLLCLLLYDPARHLYWMMTVEEPRALGPKAGLPRPTYVERFKESFKDLTPAEQRAYILQTHEERKDRDVMEL